MKRKLTSPDTVTPATSLVGCRSVFLYAGIDMNEIRFMQNKIMALKTQFVLKFDKRPEILILPSELWCQHARFMKHDKEGSHYAGMLVQEGGEITITTNENDVDKPHMTFHSTFTL